MHNAINVQLTEGTMKDRRSIFVILLKKKNHRRCSTLCRT